MFVDRIASPPPKPYGERRPRAFQVLVGLIQRLDHAVAVVRQDVVQQRRCGLFADQNGRLRQQAVVVVRAQNWPKRVGIQPDDLRGSLNENESFAVRSGRDTGHDPVDLCCQHARQRGRVVSVRRCGIGSLPGYAEDLVGSWIANQGPRVDDPLSGCHHVHGDAVSTGLACRHAIAHTQWTVRVVVESADGDVVGVTFGR